MTTATPTALLHPPSLPPSPPPSTSTSTSPSPSPSLREALSPCDMSQPQSAVPLDAAEPVLSSPRPAHDHAQTPTHDAVELGATSTWASRGTTGAIDSASAHLDLSPEPLPSSKPPSATPPSLDISPNVAASQMLAETCVTVVADPSAIPAAEENQEHESHNPIAPPTSIVPPESARDTTFSQASLSTNTTPVTPQTDPQSPKHNRRLSFPHLFPSLHKLTDGPAPPAEGTVHEGKMIFGHYATASAAQRRRNYANTNAVTDYEADLTSKDRTKQKDAVKKYLAERVRQDWTWEWPRPEPSPSEGSPAFLERARTEESIGDQEVWKERDEWLSNASDSGDDPRPNAASQSPSIPSPNSEHSKASPFRFESPDGVGQTVKKTLHERKRRRKKRLADEMVWNGGLQCFVTRRDAWTCARRVPRMASVGLSPIKLGQRTSISSGDGGSSTAIEQEDDGWEDDIEIPIAAPLIPPENAMRASILPNAYNTIYDKVVVQALTPSCPMNLKDVTRSCVQGWKRDGEWPPRGTIPEPVKRKARKLSVASLFGLEKVLKEEKDKSGAEKSPTSGGGIRRSLQKILSLGHGSNSNGTAA